MEKSSSNFISLFVARERTFKHMNVELYNRMRFNADQLHYALPLETEM